MDRLYPISKIFDIDDLIWSFNIEVIGPTTYVRGEDAASTVGITIGHYHHHASLLNSSIKQVNCVGAWHSALAHRRAPPATAALASPDTVGRR